MLTLTKIQNVVVSQYHDGQVACKMIFNHKLQKSFFVSGQIARDVKTGKFVSFKTVFC